MGIAGDNADNGAISTTNIIDPVNPMFADEPRH